MFVIGTDTFLISPLLPTLQAAYDIPTEWSGWMVSTYALGYALFALIAGPISDGMNRKRIMILGLVGFAISTFLCGIASNFWEMIVFRLLAGVSAAFVTPQVWASIPILVKPDDIIKIMGYATGGLAVSQLIGIPIGSLLAAFTWHTPFYIISILSIFLVFVTTMFFPSIEATKNIEKQSILGKYQHIFKTPRAIKYFLAYFIFQIGNFAAFSFIGSWFSESFSLSVSAIGIAMISLGLGNVIGSFFGSRIVQRLGEPKSLLLSLVILILFYIGLPFSPNLYVAEISFFFIFLIGGFIFPVFMSTLQSLTTTARGTVSALANANMYGGTTLGGVIGGVLFSHISGFKGVSLFTAILYIVSLLIYKSSDIFNGEQSLHTKDVSS
ncbi:MFS transporter [Lysinibacillus xylanilyticus]|uniref:MFS transporter n=1 Tax=Lysinibacillus xylanilyticus TaxID=582475 RepID=UPI003818F6E4